MEIILTNEQIDSVSKEELWRLLFASFNNADIYEKSFSYDDMKIIHTLGDLDCARAYLDYEELCNITILIKHLWNAAFAKKHNFPNTLKTNYGKIIWRLIELESNYAKLTRQAEGYVQNYTYQIGKNLVDKYLDFRG